jgi:hypothetical protein
MEFLKTHYEKVILSVVLIGLAAAAAWMPIKVSSEREKEDQRKAELIGRKVEPIKPLDLSTNEAVLVRLAQPTRLKLQGEHNLFNPVRWQKLPDGSLLKAKELGLNALRINEIKPLMLRVEYEGTTGTGADLKHLIAVTKETERPGPQKRTAGVGQKNPLFKLLEVAGPPEAPTSLTLLLEGDKDPITISKEKPFERVMGYSADLSYEPEKIKKTVKVKDDISFGGETYNIVAIDRNEVTVSAKSNKKQTTLLKSAQSQK